MKPLILSYAENVKSANIDYSLIEYSNEYNLSIIKESNIVAIENAALSTETITKLGGDGVPSDKDKGSYDLLPIQDKIKILMDTRTITEVGHESSDRDR